MAFAALKSMFSKPRAMATVPAGRRIYAIGDIHGRLDLFERLLAQIDADRKGGRVEIVLLGDYVDRGKDSAAVVEKLSAGDLPDWATWTFLKGNHEQAMLEALQPGKDGDKMMERWRNFGGRDTMRSYGVPSPLSYGDDMPGLRDWLLANVPPRHLDWLRGLKLSHRVGDYLFVHAGIRPGVAHDAQDPVDLMWIREEFLDSRADHGCVVVHGHSIKSSVDERANRIGIDTGAYQSGRLTALALEGETRRYLATG